MYYRLKDFKFSGKSVLVRVDFNVPQDESGNITDDSRIVEAIPTIKKILASKPRQVILCSHLGRPKGKIDMKYSMRPVYEHVKKLLDEDVAFVEQPDLRNLSLPDNRIVIIENLRFDPGEEAGDDTFAQKLAGLAELFVFDAFGAAHRAHASVSGVPKYLPTCAGVIMENEIDNLGGVLTNPKKPFIAIIGGAKADKIDLIKNLLPKVDKLIIGGILANTLLKSKGVDISASKFDDETLALAEELLNTGRGKLVLPEDVLVGDSFAATAGSQECDIASIPQNWLIMDIGPKTILRYKSLLKGAKTVVWGGPIGVFEWDRFARGTSEIAQQIASSGCTSIICGGDSGAAVAKFGLKDKMTHVSTGGGASLEFLGGKKLPGIQALEENYAKGKIFK